MLDTPGIAHAVPIVGLDGATFTSAPNAAVVFTPLDPFKERAEKGQSANALIATLNQKFAAIQEALRHQRVAAAGARHRHDGRLQDGGAGHPWRRPGAARSRGAVDRRRGQPDPGLTSVFTTFNTRTPKVYADIDRVRAEMLGVNTDDVFQTLEVYLGSQYVNDFNFLGRTYRVTAQADGDFRQDLHAIGQLKTRNAKGQMVPLSSVASFRDITGPYRVEHFNLFPSAAVQGGTQARLFDRLRASGHGEARPAAPA